ncbi:uncharacterized protein BXZ73DRAFT_97351 [Epithele typhae]|uniref:uncharacterized protein n=1 Tax=Epithele typhae TaxID=378194 RepID=UPI002008DB88|nr:uncharacterized protein BXZ73DRAFT_97351 [Epithele typhae]KAH9943302.1 hypothetical protein BXZ73DRAFT_97351 [Epithele typhae]
MCRRRHVRTVYNHGFTHPEEEVNCYGTNCIFSPNHPKDCTGERCKTKCWQYHTYPQQYVVNKDHDCPQCAAARR